MLANLADEAGYEALQQLHRLPKPACLIGKGGFAVVLRHVRAPAARQTVERPALSLHLPPSLPHSLT
jgi:hypothetical protein